jgi:tRNA dimethylallyltransferase
MADAGGTRAAHRGRDALVILGPTASGKSDVARETARRIAGEVISMDSRQVYRGMDIGTAKPSAAEQGGVPHHGFDLVGPEKRYNAGRFAVQAREWMAGIRERGRVPILAGGTGFFLRALTHPMFEEPPLDAFLKERWKQFLRELPAGELARWAARLDPDSPVRSEDRQRLARVIEVALLTGRPLSWWHAHATPACEPVRPLVFVLELPRDELYRRINQRVASMVEAGLVQEVRRLLDAGFTERDPGMNATGYIEMIPHLRGEYDLAEAVRLIQNATRRYARRQLTWLRHQLPPGACRLDAQQPAVALAAAIEAVWREEGHK